MTHQLKQPSQRVSRRGVTDALLVLVAIIWGSSYITTKDVVNHVPVLFF